MDAVGDFVWPQATSELILLPVTGLECVGDRLLAGEEAWPALVVLAGEDVAGPPGRWRRDKGCPGTGTGSGLGPGRGMRPVGRWRERGPARGGRGSGDRAEAVVAAPPQLQPAWGGRGEGGWGCRRSLRGGAGRALHS